MVTPSFVTGNPVGGFLIEPRSSVTAFGCVLTEISLVGFGFNKMPFFSTHQSASQLSANK
jgi:hypothetical protein